MRLDTELLAPAGSKESLQAALDNGADAVYFGLQSLNARQGAENFKLEELEATVEYIHKHNARAFLTLNIDLTTRDIGKAAKILTVADHAGVDAVLFTDPAILLLKPHFPHIEFHFSTQASITTSEGVKAAKDLGIARVVLAREMSAEEIQTVCNIKGVEVEVFTQGALCMCISGRCLLSSWGGGKSGNRGACTSPCRVNWRISNNCSEDILSTQDLSLIEKLPELIKNGVACLKIEGRLKNATWVGKAVKLYRDVLDGKEHYKKADTLPLGEYTGRSMTDGYYTNQRHTIFGSGGRIAKKKQSSSYEASTPTTQTETITAIHTDSSSALPDSFDLSIMSYNQTLECEIDFNNQKEAWTLPKTIIKHASRGLTISDAAGWLGQLTIQDTTMNKFITDNPNFMVSKKAVNKIADRISATIHRIKKQKTQKADTKITLTDKVRALTKFKDANPENKFTLIDKPNTMRIHISQAEEILAVIKPERIIIEETQDRDIAHLLNLTANSELIIALPTVFFEYEIKSIKKLCNACKDLKVKVEVNGWDSWKIARDIGVEFTGGIGIAVLNPLAAESLQELGFKSVAFSLEAGEKQLIDLARSCPIESMLTTFSRPILAHTRADFTDKIDETSILRDSRNISLNVHFRNDITEFRSTKPFSIGGIASPEIRVRWLCVDLINSPNPLQEWKNAHKLKNKNLFNFDKGLF